MAKIVGRNPWIETTQFCGDGPIIFNHTKGDSLSISQKENKINKNIGRD